jgi:YjbE family integral membrane protein
MKMFTSILQIIGLNLVLSSDNAVVIALAAKGLEKELKKKAIFWGSILATVMLVIMTSITSILLLVPFAAAIGGLFLLKVAFDLPRQMSHVAHGGRKTLAAAIKQIVWANLIMSFDNALALATASHGNILLMIIGISVGGVIVMGGGHAVSWALHKYPILVFVGAGVLAHAAAGMIFEDEHVNKIIHLESYATLGPIIAALLLVFVSYAIKHFSKKTSATTVSNH